MGKTEKLNKILVCPECHSGSLQYNKSQIICQSCNSEYPIITDTPLLIKSKSPIRTLFLDDLKSNTQPEMKSKIKNALKTPEERFWSRKSKQYIYNLLKESNPDNVNNIVLNVGTGVEKTFNRAFSQYNEIIKIGLPHIGKVDAFGDAMDYPIADDSVDLLFSSSVVEHLSDPELAVREINRVLKPNGIVYAEIPFLRAFHMIPIDYQRYTISGIESLFTRNGFTTINTGVSSGAFTALALFLRDFAIAITPTAIGQFVTRVITSWLFQPIKYLDRLVENRKWVNTLACNFFFVGQKEK